MRPSPFSRLTLALVFILCGALALADERTVTIESALTMEYLAGQSGEEGGIVRFAGSVVIVVREGSSVSRISADEIIYDKDNDILEARGNVGYEHSAGAASAESFSGEALHFDIKNRKGVFLDGFVRQDPGKKDADPYTVRSTVVGRDSSSTMAFRNGVLTTCDDEDPHWSIRASRIWLLPGNEIALLNGVLSIGPVPLFYIPFFYYPSDEMIFHPVFGFKNREGYFVQTTTYLIGRKPLENTSSSEGGTSFSNFMQSDSLKEQRREGLFLRNLEEDAKTSGSDYLKVIVDGYSSLGALTGVDGSFAPQGLVKSVSFSAYIGVSRTLYPPDAGLFYSTYSPVGEESWASSNFLGLSVPFRYRSTFALRMDKAPFNITVSLPIISDPWFRYDFLERKETMNWFQLLMEQDVLASAKTVSEENSILWNLSGSINPKLGFGAPYLNQFSVSAISGSLGFNSKTTAGLDAYEQLYSPERRFFYPEYIKPEIKFSLSGTLLSSNSTGRGGPSRSAPVDLIPPRDSYSGEDDTPSSAPTPANADQKSTSEALPDATDAARYIPASAIQGAVPTPYIYKSAYSLTWNLTPSVLQDFRYNTKGWDSTADIDWNSFSSSYAQSSANASLQGQYSYGQDLFSTSAAASFSGNWQRNSFLADGAYTETEKQRIELNNLKSTAFTLTANESMQITPFHRDEYFKPVNLRWSLRSKLLSSEFTGTTEQPDWRIHTAEWNKEYIQEHQAGGVAGINLAGLNQTLTISSNLPPLLEAYSGNMALNWPFGGLTLSTRLYEKENLAEKWFWDPLRAKLSWNFPRSVRLSQEYVYDIDESEPVRLHFDGSWQMLSASYTLSNTIPFRLESGSGWVLDGTEPEFLPVSAGITLDNSAKALNIKFWKNRIQFSARANATVQFNLLKLTESYFAFTPSLTFKIYESLDFTLSSVSRNDVIARYFQDWTDLPVPLPGETDMLTDLRDSFKFWDTQARERSGFKLKSLSFALTHYLHDWTMNLSYEIKPILRTDSSSAYYYDFSPEINFSVVWKPIGDIKTTIQAKEGVFSLNPKE